VSTGKRRLRVPRLTAEHKFWTAIGNVNNLIALVTTLVLATGVLYGVYRFAFHHKHSSKKAVHAPPPRAPARFPLSTSWLPVWERVAGAKPGFEAGVADLSRHRSFSYNLSASPGDVLLVRTRIRNQSSQTERVGFTAEAQVENGGAEILPFVRRTQTRSYSWVLTVRTSPYGAAPGNRLAFVQGSGRWLDEGGRLITPLPDTIWTKTNLPRTLPVPPNDVRYAEFRLRVEPTTVSGRSQILPFVAVDYKSERWTSLVTVTLRKGQSVNLPCHVTLENSGPDVLSDVKVSVSTIVGTDYIALEANATSLDAEPHQAFQSAILRFKNPRGIAVTVLTPVAEIIDRWGKLVGRTSDFHFAPLFGPLARQSYSARIQGLSPGDMQRRTIDFSIRLTRL